LLNKNGANLIYELAHFGFTSFFCEMPGASVVNGFGNITEIEKLLIKINLTS